VAGVVTQWELRSGRQLERRRQRNRDVQDVPSLDENNRVEQRGKFVVGEDGLGGVPAVLADCVAVADSGHLLGELQRCPFVLAERTRVTPSGELVELGLLHPLSMGAG